MLKYFISKLMRRVRPAAMYKCDVDSTAVVMGSSDCRFVTIGRFSYCGYHCNILECDIGSFCSIADRVVIGGAEHDITYVSTSPVFIKGSNVLNRNIAELDALPSRRTRIGNDVWIGFGATIKAGVVIGDGAVIGAGAVVTKDVKPYSVVAGVPAKQVRMRFNSSLIKEIQSIAWWDFPISQLEELGQDFNDPAVLLEKLSKL